MEHREKCKQLTENTKARLAEYEAKWPQACGSCDATGWHKWYESRPWWGATASEPMTEPCECTAIEVDGTDRIAGKVMGCCPRCRAVQLVDEEKFVDSELECKMCGWAWGRKPDDCRPELWECDCWEFEIEEKIEVARSVGLERLEESEAELEETQ